MLLIWHRPAAWLCAAVLIYAPHAKADDRPDIVIADFEAADYGDWRVEGEAFGRGPAQGTLPNQMPVSGFLGHGLVNSYVGGDPRPAHSNRHDSKLSAGTSICSLAVGITPAKPAST